MIFHYILLLYIWNCYDYDFVAELKFEETMEKLERGSGQTVVTLREARALAGRTGLADHILAAVYDYWLNKRLATQQPLLLAVRTEPRPGAPQASPYLAFRRRTEKMQTRKNRYWNLFSIIVFRSFRCVHFNNINFFQEK